MPRKRSVHHLTAAGLTVGGPDLGLPTVGTIAEQLSAIAPDKEGNH